MKKNQKSLAASFLIALLFAGCGSSVSDVFKNDTQMSFESRRGDFYKQYRDAPNEIQKSAIFNSATKWTNDFALKNSFTVNNWRGIVERIATDHGGDKVDVEIKSPENLGTKVEYRQFSIKNGSPVYSQLANLKEGDRVLFSGNFELAGTLNNAFGKTHTISEGSVTEEGAMKNPEFGIEFTTIRKADF